MSPSPSTVTYPAEDVIEVEATSATSSSMPTSQSTLLLPNSNHSNKEKRNLWQWERLVSLKPVDANADCHSGKLNDGYKRSLNAIDLTLIGIGGIIGAGIFVVTGRAAAEYAGPSLILSFIFAGLVSSLSSLCYAEMAASIPVAGSAYTYAYATMGELVAWIIGWDLTLEYLVGAATVAAGWSEYFANFVKTTTGKQIDPRFISPTWVWLEQGQKNATTAGFYRNIVSCIDGPCGSYVNLLSIALCLIIMSILMIGVRLSSSVNNIFVGVKLTVILLFIFVGIGYINPENYNPFIPPNTGVWGQFGWSGIFQASTTVFFAYIGFDAVSTAAQEAKNPRRDLPIGIMASLFICTALYIAVTAVLTGVKKYTDIDVESPVASAIPLRWLSIVIDLGALSGLISVMLVLMLAQPRILQVMSSDGLLPNVFSVVSTETGAPIWGTLITGVICAALSGILPIELLGNMTSVGTLFAFAVVCAAVPILRYTRPNLPRKFEVPGGPIVGGYIIPLLGVFFSLGLIAVGSKTSILRLLVWMAVGLVVYASYGFWNSRLIRAQHIQLAFRRDEGEGEGDVADTVAMINLKPMRLNDSE